LDWKIVEDAFGAVKDFLDLPKEKKMNVSQSTYKYHQGYEEPYYTNLDRLKKGGE
jgi:isopenicillin N synthase-like dioxygenase